METIIFTRMTEGMFVGEIINISDQKETGIGVGKYVDMMQ